VEWVALFLERPRRLPNSAFGILNHQSLSFRSQNIMDPLRTKSYEKLWSTPPTVAVLLSAL
jgi:hypothetical protein